MIVRQGESQSMTLRSGKWGGVLINAEILALVANTALTPAAWLPSGTQVSVVLSRGGSEYVVFSNNLLLLGTYCMRKNNYERFVTGFDLIQPAVGIDHSKIRTAFLKFRSPIVLAGNDVLRVEVTFNTGFSAAVDTGASFIDFMVSPSTGRDMGVPQTKFEVVPINADSGAFVNADGVRHIEFMNFDKNDWALPVALNIALSSDALNYSATYKQMLASDSQKWSENIAYRFGTAIPVASPPATVLRGLDWLPQSFTIFEAGRSESLNNCTASLTFEAANVAAAQNYVAYDTVKMDARTWAKLGH